MKSKWIEGNPEQIKFYQKVLKAIVIPKLRALSKLMLYLRVLKDGACTARFTCI